MKDNNKNKTNVPNLRFPGFEEEWERKRLGEVADKVMYGMNAAAIPFDGINKYLRITDIDDISRRFKANPLTSPSGEIEEKYQLKVGDIVLTRTGASVGKSYLYNPNDGKLLFAGFLIKFSIINANPYFVFSQTLKSNYNKWVQKMSMRSGQPGINAEEYKDLELAFPAISEQDKISTFLSLIDERIQCQNKIIEELKSFKSAVSKRIFSQELRFKDENGEECPDWEEKKLWEIAEKRIKKNIDNKIINVFTNSAINGIVNQRDFFEKDIANQNNLNGYYIVENNDFVYNPRISSTAPVGPISRNHLGSGVMSPLYSVFRLKLGNIDFIECIFNTNVWHKHMENIANYGARADRMSFAIGDFYEMPIPFPSLSEQTKIANFLSSIDEKIETEKQIIEQYKKQKAYLLQNIFI